MANAVHKAMAMAEEGIGTKDKQRLVGVREFIESPDYLDRKDSVWPKIKDEIEAMTRPGIRGAIIERGIGGAKVLHDLSDPSVQLLQDRFCRSCFGSRHPRYVRNGRGHPYIICNLFKGRHKRPPRCLCLCGFLSQGVSLV